VTSHRGLVNDIVLGERRLDDIWVRRADLALATDWKEPCTDTECKLAAIWRDIFRVDAVGARDDFFGLGGDSFTATTLAAEIEATFDIRFTPADIFNFSTIVQQAVLIAKAKGGAPKLPACLILGRSGGPKPPLFLVHAGRGFAFFQPLLLDILAEDRSTYLFQAPGLNSRATALEEIDENTTVEEFAKIYVEAMREVQPKGPYHLASVCAGAFIAVEMCRRLEMAGETIGRLILLDPKPVPPLIKSRVRPVREKTHAKGIKFGVARLLGLAPREKANRKIPQKAAPWELTKSEWELRREKLKKRVARMGNLAESERFDTEERMYRVSQQFRAALHRHVPSPYPGKATLVVCAERENIVLAKDAFWPNHLGSMERKILGTTHRDVLTDGIAETARFVKEALNEPTGSAALQEDVVR
jgi:thioesterase domain-containing protein/acyl carrier protein